MKFGKRQLILAALVVALGAAVYINWQFADNNNLIATSTVNSTKELGQATYVDNQSILENTSSSASSAASQSNSSSNSSGTSGSSSEYFSQAVLSRQQARDAALEALKAVINSEQATEDAKTRATEQIGETSKNIEQESNIENLIKAKGYPNCVAFIQNGECSIVVACDQGILESDTIIIKDIVSGQSGIAYDKVKIVQVK